MKKLLQVILSITMLVCLVGCGKEKDLAKQSQKYPWVLAHASSANTVTSLFADKFAEEVDRLSNGTMKIAVYDNSALGGDRELLESCNSGDVKFIVQNTAPQVSFMPELAVFDLPMVYDTIEDVRKALDDEYLMSVLNDIYASRGYRLLGMADQSFRVMTTNKKVSSIDDLKGQKIRTMENSNHLAFWKAIGANPAPMAFSEVYIGLQQGTIDAQENPVEVIVSSKFYEQQKYVIQTNHLPHLLSLITNSDFYNELTTEQQAIIDEAASNAKQYAREMSDARIAEKEQVIVDAGSVIVELDEETKAQIRENSKPLYDSIKDYVGEDLYNAYLKYAEWNN